MRWQPHPELGPTPPPARFKWTTGLVGLATLPVGVLLAGFCALWRITATAWPSGVFVGAGWTLAILEWLALLIAGELSIAKELGPGPTIRSALHRHRNRNTSARRGRSNGWSYP